MNSQLTLSIALTLGLALSAHAGAATKQGPVPLESEAKFQAHFGSQAKLVSPGVYDVKTETANQRYFFGLDGMRTYLEEREADYSRLHASNLTKYEMTNARHRMERLRDDLASLEAAYAQRSKCSTSSCQAYSLSCLQGYNLITNASNNSGTMSADAFATANQTFPGTPMAVYAAAELRDGYGNVISGSVDTQYLSTPNAYYVGASEADTSGTGDGTNDGACSAHSGAEYVGYNPNYTVCDGRAVYSNTIKDCG